MLSVTQADVANATPIELPDPTHEQLYRLGLSYSTGQGAPLDYVEAHKWFNLAALMIPKDAEETLLDLREQAKAYRQELSEHLSKAEIAKAQRAAREWLSKRAA